MNDHAKILVVEDEGIVALDLEERLTHLGYEVVGLANSGEEAIQKAGETMPDMVLMDIMLKGEMDGTEAAARMQSQWSLPVIYLTAFADDDILRRARQSEPCGYLLKPFTERELKASIEMALYKNEMERQRTRLIQELQEALATVKKLSGLIPICASCKKIRDEQGAWRPVEAYIRDHSEADFSHGLCPDCRDKLLWREH